MNFFFLFRAAPAAYGSSGARGRIGAVAAGLHHSHSNARSLTHWVRPGIEPTSSWIFFRFVSSAPWRELWVFIYKLQLDPWTTQVWTVWATALHGLQLVESVDTGPECEVTWEFSTVWELPHPHTLLLVQGSTLCTCAHVQIHYVYYKIETKVNISRDGLNIEIWEFS